MTPIEEKIVIHAAPTLAGCKVANLLNLPNSLCDRSEINFCRRCLDRSGIGLKIILENETRRLIYVYRRSLLKTILNDSDIQDFLFAYGYTDFSISASLRKLSRHFSHMRVFPHEIGIFLGYPLLDVKGYILNNGKNAKLTGYWKVYGNEEYAKKVFATYLNCRKNICERFQQGAGLTELSAVL